MNSEHQNVHGAPAAPAATLEAQQLAASGGGDSPIVVAPSAVLGTPAGTAIVAENLSARLSALPEISQSLGAATRISTSLAIVSFPSGWPYSPARGDTRSTLERKAMQAGLWIITAITAALGVVFKRPNGTKPDIRELVPKMRQFCHVRNFFDRNNTNSGKTDLGTGTIGELD